MKSIGTVVWEPISVGLQIVVGKIKNVFISMINFIKKQFNDLSQTWVGQKLGLEPLEMTDLVNTDNLSIANTTLGQFFQSVNEDNISNLTEFTEAQREIWKNYFNQIRSFFCI